jgi:hypothetical protein
MHFTVFAGGRVQSGSSDEEALHHKTGTVLSVHLLLHEASRMRSSRIRHAEVFQSIATLGAPDGAYVGSQWIHRAGSGTGPVDSPVDSSGDTARFGIGLSDQGLLLRHILQVQRCRRTRYWIRSWFLEWRMYREYIDCSIGPQRTDLPHCLH